MPERYHQHQGRELPTEPAGHRVQVYGVQHDANFSEAARSENSARPANYWLLIVEHKYTLISTAILGVLVAVLLTSIQTPSYRSRVLVQAEEMNEDFLNKRDITPTSANPSGTPESLLRTEVLILQSTPVLERVLSAKNIESRLDHLAKSTAVKPNVFSVFAGISPSENDSNHSSRQNTLGILEQGLRVRVLPNTRVIEITFDSNDPKIAADVANSVVSKTVEFSRDNQRNTSMETSEWLSGQLADVKSALERAEGALQSFASGPSLAYISENVNASEEKLRELQTQLLKAHEERITKQSLYELTSGATPSSFPETLDDPLLKDYESQLSNLRRQLAELNGVYTAEHPKVITVKSQIETVQGMRDEHLKRIATRIRSEYVAALRREALLSADYGTQAKVVSNEASRVAHYSVLKSEVDTNRQVYNTLLQKVKEAALASSLETNTLRIIEPAAPPLRPRTPNPLANTALGLCSGTLLGLGMIFWRTRFQPGIEEPGQIANELRLHELGVIPSVSAPSSHVRKFLRGPTDHPPLELASTQPWSRISESFRFVSASILLSERHPRTLAITSARAGEGKTTVISNIAVSLAQTGKRVLLVDADIRKPRLHEVFEVANSVGLSDSLSGNLEQPAIQATQIRDVFLLPSGGSVTEQLFFSDRFADLLRKVAAEFDVVLIDTPPLEIADSRIIGRLVDAVVLVVAQHSDLASVQSARQRLAADGSTLLGTILNNWTPIASVRGSRGGSSGNYFGSYYVRN